jgi:hypothetical protein
MSTPSTNEEVFKYYTQKAGDVNRQFGFVAVGLIWLFHGIEVPNGQQLLQPLDSSLKFSLYFVAVSLSIDLLQYIVGALMWRSEFIREPLGEASTCKTSISVSVAFIVLKLAFMLVAYISILCFLFSKTNLI